MNRIIVLLALALITLSASAQKRKFSPEKFQAELEQFVIKEANLTPQETAKLLPLFREMHEKQRAIHNEMRRLSKNKPADEAGCERAIKEYDKMNIELRHLEHGYHKRMMQELSASKVYDVIKAESRFHRRMMKGWQHKDKSR